MLNTTSARAARIPAMHSAVIQAKRGNETVRNSFTTTVRSGGTFPPIKRDITNHIIEDHEIHNSQRK